MRLIEAKTLKLVEVIDETVKSYAILSHRWGEQEVNFKAMGDLSTASEMKGFAKIQMSCNQAITDGLDFVWVDTCCIDKDSSAELSKAINSMYRWYQASRVCYAFLEDVENEMDEMRHSVWFTRGWTLQELIAPKWVVFFNRHWRYLGTKKFLSNDLAQWTGIDLAVLEGKKSSSICSVACRMSWASKRVTTRVEDTAYCLMGMFNINMPLLYGEGKKAFLRLQLEIIKESDDHTIFAWPMDRNDLPGLLAPSPKLFESCAAIERKGSRAGHAPYSMTNRGLSMKFMAIAWAVDTYLVPLGCFNKSVRFGEEGPIGIFLKRLVQDDQYARVRFDDKSLPELEASISGIGNSDFDIKLQVKQLNANIRQDFIGQSNTFDSLARDNGFRIANRGLLLGIDSHEVTAHDWNQEKRFMSAKLGHPAVVGLIDTTRKHRRI